MTMALAIEDYAPASLIFTLYIAEEADGSWSVLTGNGADPDWRRTIASGFASYSDADMWLQRTTGSLGLALNLMTEHDIAKAVRPQREVN